jgi:hypothetical protein
MESHVFRFEEAWDIPNASPEEVWDVLARGELLPLWWKGVYLEAVPLDPGSEPRVGRKVKAKARGFLPYVLSFVIEAVELTRGRLVVVKIEGDFDGRWSATLRATETSGTHVDLVWETTLKRPWMRRFAPLLRPLFAWNHYWTTPRGEAGLKAYLEEHAMRSVLQDRMSRLR